MNYGIITLLPALLVIVVAIKSKRTTEALLMGCVSSYAIIAIANRKNPVTLQWLTHFFQSLQTMIQYGYLLYVDCLGA